MRCIDYMALLLLFGLPLRLWLCTCIVGIASRSMIGIIMVAILFAFNHTLSVLGVHGVRFSSIIFECHGHTNEGMT